MLNIISRIMKKNVKSNCILCENSVGAIAGVIIQKNGIIRVRTQKSKKRPKKQ